MMKLTGENKERLNFYIDIIEKKLASYNNFDEENFPQKNLADAMNYSLSAGGKRVRPVLMLEFCRLCGGDFQKALSPAAAMEMIHTFSLIHDDLPCMDDDDFRRGKPSCHKKFGEAIALLAGDALENLAFEVIADCELPDRVKINLIRELSNAVGINGMIGGQVIDIENEGKGISEDLLYKMHSCKTGALIKAACRMGCIAADADGKKLLNAGAFAEKIGLAFQIIDDILNVAGDEKVLGKPVGSDIKHGKTTFVTIYGLEKSMQMAEALTNEAISILKEFDENEFIVDFTKNLLLRKK